MRKVVLAGWLLLTWALCGCGDSCQALVDEACRRHGEDSVTCIARTRDLENLSEARERLCERALMLYRSMPENEQAE